MFIIGDRVKVIAPGHFLFGETGIIKAFSGPVIYVLMDVQKPWMNGSNIQFTAGQLEKVV